jgi:dihydroorotase
VNPDLLIKGGRVIDPQNERDGIANVLIREGRIVKVGSDLPAGGASVYDASGKWVIPGVIDLHVHLRDFKQAYKETIATGTAAALKGGVTTVLTMPNTDPRLDSPEAIRDYLKLIHDNAKVRVHIAAAITQGLRGRELALLESYPDLFVKFITDDGFDIDDEALLESAYRKAKLLGLTLMTHPEVHSIAPEGLIHEGEVSEKLGVPGQPSEKEWKAVERGIRLAEKTGAHAHFTHLSTKESVELIRSAKKRNRLISCDTTPHHITLTHEAVLEHGALAKVNPPLRTEADRQALINGLKDGTIDCVVTDHAPHSAEEKSGDLKTAAPGFSEIEALVPAVFTELHFKQGLPASKVVDLLTRSPARLAHLSSLGHLGIGATADLTLIDPDSEKPVKSSEWISKGKNTPFEGMLLKAWPVATIFEGTLSVF